MKRRKDIEKEFPEEIKEREGGVSMCDVLEYREEKGKELIVEDLILKNLKKGKTVKEIAEFLEISEDAVNAVREKTLQLV